MENLRRILNVLFLQRDSEQVISSAMGPASKRQDEWVDVDWIVRSFREIDNSYNLDQIASIADMLVNLWLKTDTDRKTLKFCKDKSVFNALLHFGEKSLGVKDNQPVCLYDSLLRWNDITALLGEDIFTTSFLASVDIVAHYNRTKFDWSPVIGHDNESLNALFSRPMADLHSHMKGSSLNFELNWLCLMNYLGSRRETFRMLNYRQEPMRVLYNNEHNVPSLYLSTIKAGAIRYLLLLVAINSTIADTVKGMIRNVLLCKTYDEVIPYVGDLDRLLKLERLLWGKKYVQDHTKNLIPDYAIQSWLVQGERGKEFPYTILAGERFIMYSMFQRIFLDELKDKSLATLFYAYLLIKADIRHEIVQLNENIGFENFNIYERRKEIFIDGFPLYESLISQYAIGAFFDKKEKGSYFETRIVPKNTASEIERQMVKLDKEIKDKRMFPDNVSHDNDVRYIFHFIKQSDKTKRSLWNICPRHYELRKRIKKQSLAIFSWRKHGSSLVNKVVGIDAANSECKCRPEVFAQAYRFLRYCSSTNTSEKKISVLHFTYHVGEDFYDIVDGLRAVDEVIKFLNFRNGDRLGHGLVLGTDVVNYYKRRHMTVVMSKQNLLDNIVWLFVEGSDSDKLFPVKQKLMSLYEFYIRDIYGYDESIPTIMDYYQSWLLRGDNPYCYSNNGMNDNAGRWFRYSKNEQEDACKARRNKVARDLFTRYHFDGTVKERGIVGTQLKLDGALVELIGIVQEKMLNIVEQMKICIESNPTSNRKIGEFLTFDMHPLTRFYNVSLDTGNKKHGVSVSINTDDRGVFATSIEREFSVVAAALEKKSIKTKSDLSPREIYEWLDRIRQMAFEQKFS